MLVMVSNTGDLFHLLLQVLQRITWKYLINRLRPLSAMKPGIRAKLLVLCNAGYKRQC